MEYPSKPLANITYKYYKKNGDSEVCLVVHGGGPVGIETPFISQIINTIADSKRSVFGFNLPYCEREEEKTSQNLTEEVAALAEVVNYLRSEGYQKITLIGKSLGAIVASFYLEQNPDADLDAVVLGYVLDSVKTEALRPRLRLVIQGEEDRFGDSDAVRQALNNSTANVIGIDGADHSYRDRDRQPAYQAEAIKILLENLKA